MIFNLGIIEILVILMVCYIIFGRNKLPGMGKKAGLQFRKFKESTKGLNQEVDEVKDIITSINKDIIKE